MHLRIRIVDCQNSVWRQIDGPIHGLEALLIKRIVVIDAPPAFAITGVSDIKLRAWILLGRIGSRPYLTGRAKLISAKQFQTVVELFLINFIKSGGDSSVSSDLIKRSRLGRINPDDDAGINQSPNDAGDLNEFVLHGNYFISICETMCFGSSGQAVHCSANESELFQQPVRPDRP